MARITVDGRPLEVPEGTTLLQALDGVGLLMNGAKAVTMALRTPDSEHVHSISSGTNSFSPRSCQPTAPGAPSPGFPVSSLVRASSAMVSIPGTKTPG